MKSLKRIAAMLLTLVMMLTIVPADTVKAASDNFPTKFRVNYYWGNEDRTEIQMPDHHTYIKNVKSMNANLIAGLVSYDYASFEKNPDTYILGFIAKKEGTYDITYDVMKDSKKLKTVKAKVYAYSNPISVKLDGVNGSFYGDKTTAKLNVTALNGNTIQKIEVGTYKKTEEKDNNDWSQSEKVSSVLNYQTVKNNSKIKLGTTGYYFKNVTDYTEEDSYYEYFRSDLMSRTFVRVTYKDKYTKQNEQYEISFSGLAK